jgi:hypothetical protein
MAKVKSPVKKLLKLRMIDCDINSFMELARITGIDYQRLNKRLVDPHSFTVFELLALEETLHLTDEDLLKLIRG